MRRFLKSLLSPPRYEDFEEDRLSRLGANLLAFLLVFSPLAAVANFLLAQRTGIGWIISFSVHLILLIWARFLLQKRYLRQSLSLMIFSVWAILNWSSFFFAGGVSSAVFTGNLVVIVLAGFLLGRRQALGATILSVLIGVGMLRASAAGLVPPDIDTRTELSDFVTTATYFLCVMFTIYFFVSTYEHTLSRWQQNEKTLLKTNSKLKQYAKQLESQNEYLETVHRLSLDLLDRRQLSAVLREVLDSAIHMFDATDGYIYLLHSDGRMRVEVGRGVFEGRNSPELLPGDGLSGKVWQRNEPIRVEDYDAWHGRYSANPEGIFLSVLGVPLRSGQDVVGVLGITRKTQGNPFGEQDEILLTKFAELASIALDNARLFTAAQGELAVRIQAEARNQALLNAIPDLIMRVDVEGNYKDVRSPNLAVLPVSNLGSSLKEILPEALYKSVKELLVVALESQTLQKSECQWPELEEYFDIRVMASGEDELLVIWRKISERMRTEQALREKQKLESLGVLAGGVAHDFNNLLTGIMAQTSLLGLKIPADDPLQKNVKRAMSSAVRAADLTRQLLAYAGQAQIGLTLVDLNEMVQDNAALLETPMMERATLQLDLQEKLPPIMAERGQLQQLVMNLIINAADSLPASGGVVKVRTCLLMGPVGPPKTRLVGNTSLPAGPYICLEVRDTGSGMDDATIERIFDPFFTTKETGHGLGLSATLGIIRSYNGGISVTSTPDVGSAFQIFFPAEIAKEIVEPESPQPLQLPSGLVLVIDDEVGVRDALQDTLELEEIEVITAMNGVAGIELFKQRNLEIEVVILDMVMPGISGPDTLKAIRAINPLVPVIMSSGYSKEGIEKQLGDQSNIYIMPKPYDRSKLLTLLSQIEKEREWRTGHPTIAAP